MTPSTKTTRRRPHPASCALAAALAVALGVIVHQKFGGIAPFIAQARAVAGPSAVSDPPAAPAPPPAPHPFTTAQERDAERAAAALLRYARHGRHIAPERLRGYDCALALYRQAGDLEHQGLHAAAAGAYEQAIQETPRWWELYFQLGWCLKREGQMAAAEQTERRAARLGVDKAWAYYSVGDMLLEQHRDAEAIPYYLAFVRLDRRDDPDLFMGYRRLGAIHEVLGGCRWAVGEDRTWTHLCPSDADAHDSLSYDLAMIGDQAGSARECRAALRLRPDDVLATDNLGDALGLLGNRAGARRAWARVLQLTTTGDAADDARKMLAQDR